jgi:hypothetical protein
MKRYTSTLEKSPKKTNNKEGKFNFAHCFRGFGPWLLGFSASGPVRKESIMVESL